MAISDRVRKIIWSRAGNLCLQCKTHLVTRKSDPFATTVIGEECHIVSKAISGPRHRAMPQENYDQEDNLMLLCANCHKVIDSNVNDFTEHFLKSLKDAHESTIEAALTDTHTKSLKDTNALPQVKTGMELLALLDGVMAIRPHYENTDDDDEVQFIAAILENFEDYNDLISMHDEPSFKVSLIPKLKSLLLEIDQRDFVLFGEVRNEPIEFGNGKQGDWQVSTLCLIKKDNPSIVVRTQ